MTETKKTALMIVDGGHLRKLLTYSSRNPNVPRMTPENIERILRGCVTDDEDLQRIYYYDCTDFTGRFHTPYPGWARGECFAMYKSDLAQRIKRGSQFHILNPSKTGDQLVHTEAANTAIWAANQHTSDVFRRLAQRDLFVVRYGEMKFKGWEKNARNSGPEYFPSFQQKGVDMLIGLDIATIAITGQAQRIIFVANDTDFVPALKFARRTGRNVQVVIIDLPGRGQKSPALKENSDYCRKVAWPEGLEMFQSKPPTAMANAFKNKRKPT